MVAFLVCFASYVVCYAVGQWWRCKTLNKTRTPNKLLAPLQRLEDRLNARAMARFWASEDARISSARARLTPKSAPARPRLLK